MTKIFNSRGIQGELDCDPCWQAQEGNALERKKFESWFCEDFAPKPGEELQLYHDDIISCAVWGWRAWQEALRQSCA